MIQSNTVYFVYHSSNPRDKNCTAVIDVWRTDLTNKWLVFGASGYVGRNLVPYLLEQGHAVKAAARNLS
ncbi:NAD-dependent epimerase/dehydratase family protein, partial [Arthrospira platensis SPKY1]|nr:NAD-dependent epimerase/dehydratase family protein [Arthrospira platensis SPKY1]